MIDWALRLTAGANENIFSAMSIVREKIETDYGKLSGKQRRAADYLLTHYRTAFALSVSELASAAGVSEATLVRFARELGFAGFLDLRNALMEEAQKGLAPVERFALAQPSEEPAATVLKVAAQEVANINRTIDQIDKKSFSAVIAGLKKANLVVAIGSGVSALLARLAAYEFNQIGVPSHCLLLDVMSMVEQIELVPRGSAVLAFAFPPYSPETISAAARAKKRRLGVFAVTDGLKSPLRAHARALLVAESENLLFTNSLSGAMLLINAIVTELALANKGRALRQLELSRAAYGEGKGSVKA